MTSQRTLTHEFVFEIEGENVSPQTVGLRNLLEILANFEAAVAVTAKSHALAGEAEAELHLVSVGDGSDRLTFAATERAYRAASTITRAIATDDFESVPLVAHESLRRLSKCSRSTGWTFRLSTRRNGHAAGTRTLPEVIEAAITPDKELMLPTEVTGATTLLARVDRVGGESSPTASVYLERGEKLTVELRDKVMAQSLGDRLFQVVSLDGIATWNYETWSIKRFVVQRIGEFEDTSAKEAFRALSEAAGNRWESVDPMEFVAELRRE